MSKAALAASHIGPLQHYRQPVELRLQLPIFSCEAGETCGSLSLEISQPYLKSHKLLLASRRLASHPSLLDQLPP